MAQICRHLTWIRAQAIVQLNKRKNIVQTDAAEREENGAPSHMYPASMMLMGSEQLHGAALGLGRYSSTLCNTLSW